MLGVEKFFEDFLVFFTAGYRKVVGVVMT